MKEVKKLTMFDFFTHLKLAMFNLTLKKDFNPKSDRYYTYLRWMAEDKQIGFRPFLRLWDIYKEVLPGLKRKEMKAVWEEWYRLSSKRMQNRPDMYRRHFILSKDQYNMWAKKVWEKRGSPRFHKRIISGIIFGAPYNSVYSVRKTIARRYVGVEIKDGVRIRISIVR